MTIPVVNLTYKEVMPFIMKAYHSAYSDFQNIIEELSKRPMQQLENLQFEAMHITSNNSDELWKAKVVFDVVKEAIMLRGKQVCI